MTRLPDNPEFRTCARCSLCNTAETGSWLPIPGEGPVPADIMFIGEAAGGVEQRTGKPFQGPAGGQLDLVIVEAGLSRADVYISNMVKQRPVDGGKNRRPTYAEIMACMPWLQEEIAAVDPRVIVLFGETAHQMYFPGTKPHQVVGSWRATPDGRIAGCSYHPAFILYRRDPTLRQMLVDVVVQAKGFL